MISFKFSPQSNSLYMDISWSFPPRREEIMLDMMVLTIMQLSYYTRIWCLLLSPTSTNGAVICDCCGPSASSSLLGKEAGRCHPSTSGSFSSFALNSKQLISNSPNQHSISRILGTLEGAAPYRLTFSGKGWWLETIVSWVISVETRLQNPWYKINVGDKEAPNTEVMIYNDCVTFL